MRDNKSKLPVSKAKLPATRSNSVPVTLDKHARLTELATGVSTVLRKFGERTWSKFEEKYFTSTPNPDDIAAARALAPNLPQVRKDWAQEYQPTPADFIIAELGMIAEGMPLANNISPKVFLKNALDNLRRLDPPPTFWEVREARIAYVGKHHFGDVAGFMEVFAEKRKEAERINKLLKPGVFENRLKTAEQLEKEHPATKCTIGGLDLWVRDGAISMHDYYALISSEEGGEK